MTLGGAKKLHENFIRQSSGSLRFSREGRGDGFSKSFEFSVDLLFDFSSTPKH